MVTSSDLQTEESPRSTVITAVAPSSIAEAAKSVPRMTKSGGPTDDATPAAAEPSGAAETNADGKGTVEGGAESPEANQGENLGDRNGQVGLSPTPQPHSYLQGYPTHLTPQQAGQGYYPLGYQSQATPEPPSPGGPGANVYDVGSFFQQQGAFQQHNSPFVPGTPSSPRRAAAMGGIPPASPLFPRVSTAAGASGLVPGAGIDHRLMGAPPSPSVPYLSPPLGPNSMYPGYAANQSDSPDDIAAWGDRNQSNMFPPGSPQMNAQGLPVPYVPGMTRANAGRAYSFDDPTGMLPPAVDQHDPGNPGYGQYGQNQSNAGGAGGTLFANQQPFGYGGGPVDMYGAPGSPLQPRPAAQMPGYPGHPMGGGMRQMGLYGQYYPATSPGPPIQTTESNKGPDGANLFIFHIPNHFTNLDMYQLFCPYGNLLSVRIMVEKDTGRSRGFGFVSYDSVASAALAIKDLNGFAIGNKRLKVQHKQIRPSDQHQEQRDNAQDFYGVGGGADANFRGGYGTHLPPSGAMAAHNMMNPASPWLSAPQSGVPGGDDGTGGGQPIINPDAIASSTPGLDAAAEGALSPLASLEPLRDALPDVTGNE